MVEIGDPSMQAQEFLRSFSPLEALLTSLLTSCAAMLFLNNVVAPGCGDHLLVVDISEGRDLPDRGCVAAELISMNDLWDVILTQEAGQKGLRSFRVSVPLKENVEYEAVLIHGLPKPVSDAIDARTDLVQMPPRTPTRFAVA